VNKNYFDNDKLFIIGEIGINHNGSINTAKKLIDVAFETGCNAVKFQKRDLKSIYTKSVLENLENHEQGFQYLMPILKEFEFDIDQMKELKFYCDEKGIEFFCTPFDIVSAVQINDLGVRMYKVSSADLVNLSLIEKLISFNKPIMFSTGMSSGDEIEKTIKFMEERSFFNYSLLHCVSSYPVEARDANMKRIPRLKERFKCPIGYSGHDIGSTLSVVAVSLGANIVEKHITLDRTMRGPDHKLSLEPDDLRSMVVALNEAKASLSNKDTLLQGEMLNKMVFRKSIVAKRPLKAGELFTADSLTTKSPGTGLCPQNIFELVGKKVVRDLEVDDLIYESDLAEIDLDSFHTSLPWGRQGYVVRYHDFETVLENGLESIEFHFTYKDTCIKIPHEKLEKYKDKLSKLTLRIHCCEYIGEDLFDILSLDKIRREKAGQILQKVINITSEIAPYFNGEPPMIVFNCGAMTLNEDPSYIQQEQIDDFHRIVNSLDRKGTYLLAQCMPPFPWYYGGQWFGYYFLQAEELLKFCEATGHYICLDLSHAQMACSWLGLDFVEYINKIKPYVRHIHISDAAGYEGEGVQIGTGTVPFGAFFKAYEDYDGTWIPEIWQGHVNNNEGAKLALTKLEKIYFDEGLK